MAKRKLTVKKYDGDDAYSWAVFYADEVKGMGSQIFYGDAKPLVSGCGKLEANTYKKNFEARQGA